MGGVSQLVPQVLSMERLGPAVGRTGRAIVGVSHCGEYVSVCWPASRGYVVYYRTLAGTWQEVESGSGVDLAWHSHRCVRMRHRRAMWDRSIANGCRTLLTRSDQPPTASPCAPTHHQRCVCCAG
jgi:hypothetical protein